MRLEIQCEDRIGMVSEILNLLVSCQIDVRLIEIESKRRCIYCGFSDIPFTQLQNLLADIRRLASVEDVKTIMFTPFEQEHSSLYSLLESLPDGAILVDLKGKITMMTRKAEAVFNVKGVDFLHVPFSQLVKTMAMSKGMWSKPRKNLQKRVRVDNQRVLLEINPILVSDEEGVKKPVATAVYVKTERAEREKEKRRIASLQLDKSGSQGSLQGHFQGRDQDSTQHSIQNSEIESAPMQRAFRDAEIFCALEEPLLIQGGFSTGKKRLARAMFKYWQQQQFDSAHCVIRHAKDISVDEIMVLYASSNWLIIDEVQYLKCEVQEWLVGMLDANCTELYEREPRARLITLTSLSASQILNEYGFNKPLYFALSSLTLSMPSLIGRVDDIESLILNTLAKLSKHDGIAMPTLSKQAMLKLRLYPWPGNLKELENVCSRLLLTVRHGQWQAEDIDLPEQEEGVALNLIDNSLERTVKLWEAALLKKMYVEFPSTRRLAKAVGVSHSTIATKLKEYGIQN